MYEPRQDMNKSNRVIAKRTIAKYENPNIYLSCSQIKHKGTLKSGTLLYKYIQRKMNPNGNYEPMTPPQIKPNVVITNGTQPLTGSPIKSEVFITTEVEQTLPANLNGMQRWKGLGLLQEPVLPQTLTRMHVINGTFHGPSNSNNMVLGTAASNNSAPKSHYNEVERPIKNFLRECQCPRAVHYIVIPNYSPPFYIKLRYLFIRDNQLRRDFISWSVQGCPNILYCIAIFYKCLNGKIYGYIQKEQIQTDL